MIDVHSHILPSVDDGSRDLATSINILRGLSGQGITDVILTPHYVAETSYTNTRKNNQKILGKLQTAAQEAQINIQLYLGNEIYIDRDIAKFLRQHKISSLADSKYLLIELPMSGKFESYEDIFLSLQQSGWQVLMAHPERYYTTQKDYTILQNLHTQGILFQCNLGSLIGQYGKSAQKTLKKLLKDDFVFCFGTDIHRERDYSEITKAQQKLHKIVKSNAKIQDLLVNHPRQILA